MTPMSTPNSWRDVLPVHPAADMFPVLGRDELLELGRDIAAKGLTSPVVLWSESTKHGDVVSVLDGRNRLDAMEAVGIEFGIDNETKCFGWAGCFRSGSPWSEGENLSPLGLVTGPCNPEEQTVTVIKADSGVDPYEFVLSANAHRRHLTTEQKRGLIDKILKTKAELSDRQIGKIAKADHKTVAAARTKLEGRGEIPHVAARKDTTGRAQPARKPKQRTLVTKGADRAVSRTTQKMKAQAIVDRLGIETSRWLHETINDDQKVLNALANLITADARVSLPAPLPVTVAPVPPAPTLADDLDLDIPDYLKRTAVAS
jgi:hypothetical protein